MSACVYAQPTTRPQTTNPNPKPPGANPQASTPELCVSEKVVDTWANNNSKSNLL